MTMVKWVFIVMLLLPLAEIVVFIVMALTLGWLWTFALFLGSSLIGIIVLRRCGRAKLDLFVSALGQDGIRALHLESPGLAPIMGGILLVLPGFLTDILGAMLFVHPLRRWAGATLARAWQERRRDPHAPAVIDLAPDQWDEQPDQIEHR